MMSKIYDTFVRIMFENGNVIIISLCCRITTQNYIKSRESMRINDSLTECKKNQYFMELLSIQSNQVPCHIATQLPLTSCFLITMSDNKE